MTPDIVILFVIIILGLALFSLEVFPIEVTALGMLIALILFGLLPADMAFQGFGSDTALMMFGILVLTASLEQTGVADLAGRLMLRGEDLRVPRLVAIIMVVAAVFSAFMGNTATAAFFLLTVLLTQPMSNQAAAAVVFPVAITTAHNLGLNPRTFAMMIAVAASTSFITPLEPACLLIYGPGRYQFFDFVRVGLPLTLIIYSIAILLVPWVWPLL